MTSFDDMSGLSDSALLDIVAGTEGAGARLLAGDEVSGIFKLSPLAISQRAELDEDGARRVAAAFTLASRLRKQRGAKKPRLETVGDAVELLRHRARLATQEEAFVVGLDMSQRLIGIRCIGVGTHERIPIDISLVIRHVCELSAGMFIVIHFHVDCAQHPPRASISDYVMTARIREIATSLNLCLVDHLVIGRSGKAISVLRRLEAKETKAAEKRKREAERKKKKRTRDDALDP